MKFNLTNTGTMAGEEVVQVYAAAIGSKVERAPKELKAFARVALEAGETKTVTFHIPVQRLAYYDETLQDFVVEPIEYEFIVGTHSLDSHALRARIAVHMA